MRRYYYIKISNSKTNSSESDQVDSFSIDKNGVLKMQSKHGDKTVKLEEWEHLSVCTLDIKYCSDEKGE